MRFARSVSLCLVVGLFSAAVESAESKGPTPIRWQTDYVKAHQQRLADNRPMLVFMTMDGCPYCVKMLRETYHDQDVAARVSATFVPTFVNGSAHQEIVKQFPVRIYPTTFVVSADNRITHRIEGYVDAEELQKQLSKPPRTAARSARSSR